MFKTSRLLIVLFTLSLYNFCLLKLSGKDVLKLFDILLICQQ